MRHLVALTVAAAAAGAALGLGVTWCALIYLDTPEWWTSRGYSSKPSHSSA